MTEFTHDAAIRVARATREVEKMPRGQRWHRGRAPVHKHEWHLAKLDGSLSTGGTATASIWTWDGSSFADSGDDVTVHDWLLASGQTVASGTKVIIELHRTGIWIVTEAECA